ncbi:MAG TPA: cytochrome ubiquinol oxidase subunit I, partial [Acidimicrobiaceae bacterium]|nr:cytochrome ubiquinol oxidase subunit I [Acidimicrobiaceae bacterium]
EDGKVVRRATAAEVCHTGDAVGVHLPSPSYWPVVLAAGLPLIGFGLLYNLWICVPGTLMVLGSIYAWVFEP